MKYVMIALIVLNMGCSTDVYRGEKGDKGDSGATGSQGDVGSQGSAGSNGADGAAGANGQDGANGSDGANGQDGTNGTNGSDGTIVTAIQLCDSSFVPTYPNIFPEVAFCIGGELYGSYSTHGGFLALLPPGSYSSNGVHASCTFTVAANCVVN